METKTGIYTKLAAIMGDIDRIPKTGFNKDQNYPYATEKDIKEFLHAALVKHRVVFLMPEMQLLDMKTGLGKSGNTILTTIKAKYVFADADSGETVSGECISQGTDSQDKGIYKAITGALKYALTTTFMIPTGDDPEKSKDRTAPGSREQQQAVASRKIQEMRHEQAAYSEGKPRISGPKAETWDGRVVIAQFERAKQLIGEAAYNQVLKEAGIDLPEHSPDRDFATKLYRRMADVAIKQGKDLSKAS
jgi:hypothetical protein